MAGSSLISQLYERKMFRITAGYLAVAWVVWQVIVTTCEAFECTPGFLRNIFWLLAAGLPITLSVAWVNWKTAIIVGVAFLAGVGITVVMMTGFQTPTVESVIELTDEVVLEEVKETESERLPNSVAVLPFENLSPDPNNAYFAAGIHESTLNQLTKIRNLIVIARTTVLNPDFADGSMSVPEIAKELNVEMVMEGSVRYANDRVLITSQLIDGRTGAHVWSCLLYTSPSPRDA